MRLTGRRSNSRHQGPRKKRGRSDRCRGRLLSSVSISSKYATTPNSRKIQSHTALVVWRNNMNAISAEVPVCAEIHAVIGSLRKPGLDGTRNQLLGKAIGVDFDLDPRGFSSKGFDRRGYWSSDRAGRNSDGREGGEDGGELHFCWWVFLD